MTRLTVGGLLVVLVVSAAAADEGDSLDPDRPDVSFSAKTVGAGRAQLEMGVLLERTRLAGEPTERRLAVETAVRIGIGDRFELPAQLALDVNAGIAALGQSQPSGYLLQALASASLSRKLAATLTGFAEVFYTSREEWRGCDQVGVDTGLVWAVRPDFALDAAVGTSLYGRVPDVFVRTGGSVRFGR